MLQNEEIILAGSQIKPPVLQASHVKQKLPDYYLLNIVFISLDPDKVNATQ
jgi:hypothetical protein